MTACIRDNHSAMRNESILARATTNGSVRWRMTVIIHPCVVRGLLGAVKFIVCIMGWSAAVLRGRSRCAESAGKGLGDIA